MNGYESPATADQASGSDQVVTLHLPARVIAQIRQAAENSHRPVHELMVEAITAVAPVWDAAPDALRSSLAQMAYLNDAALWRAARSIMAPEQRERMAELHEKMQREPLTPEEAAEEERLIVLYRETILVRAQAAVLLKQRGYDISEPSQFMPQE